MKSESEDKEQSSFVILLFGSLLITAYSFCFIWNSSFLLDGKRVFTVFDDQLISMTYAKNLLDGYGLNWAKYGDPVEGFSNPLWVALIVLIHLIEDDLFYTSLYIQCMSMVFLIANGITIFYICKDFLSKDSLLVSTATFLLTAFYFPLNYWGLYGFEISLQVLLLSISLYYLFDEFYNLKDRAVTISFLLALACLLRIDSFLFSGAILFALCLGRFLRGRTYASMLRAGLFFVALNLGYFVFRYFYFDDFLPNTYYLKVQGMSRAAVVRRGYEALNKWYLEPNFYPLLLVSVGGLIFAQRKLGMLFCLLLFWSYLGYSVYVGGDAWDWQYLDNRWIALATPLLFLVFASLCHGIIEFRDWKSNTVYRYGSSTFVVFAALLLFSYCNDIQLSLEDESWKNNLSQLTLQQEPSHLKAHKSLVPRAMLLNEIASPQVKVATLWAGIPAYFGRQRMIDALGYNDRRVARMDLDFGPNDWRKIKPGHNKMDFDYSYSVLKADIVFQWGYIDKEVMEEFFEKENFVRKFGITIREFKGSGLSFFTASDEPVNNQSLQIELHLKDLGRISSIQLRNFKDNEFGFDTIESSGFSDLIVHQGLNRVIMPLQIDSAEVLRISIMSDVTQVDLREMYLVIHYENLGFQFVEYKEAS